jgi:hypothetical protein
VARAYARSSAQIFHPLLEEDQEEDRAADQPTRTRDGTDLPRPSLW